MNDTEWNEIVSHQLEQKHVGKLVRIDWNDGQTVTGRLAVLQFAHEHVFYQGGSKELRDRLCKVILEIGTEQLQLTLPLNAYVAVKG